MPLISELLKDIANGSLWHTGTDCHNKHSQNHYQDYSLNPPSILGIDLGCVCYANPSGIVHNSKLERLHTAVYKNLTLCIAVSNALGLNTKDAM